MGAIKPMAATVPQPASHGEEGRSSKEWSGTVSKGPSMGAAKLSRRGTSASGRAGGAGSHVHGARGGPRSTSAQSYGQMSRPQSRSSVRTAASTSASVASLFTPESRLKRSSLAVVSALFLLFFVCPSAAFSPEWRPSPHAKHRLLCAHIVRSCSHPTSMLM